MEFPGGTEAEARAIIESALAGQLSRAQAQSLARLDPIIAEFAWLAVVSRIADLQAALGSARAVHPSTPSGQIPIYQKASAGRRKGKPGARPGHRGVRRQAPAEIHRHEEHRLEVCPRCGGPVQRCDDHRTRVIADIPQELQAEATEHAIYRDYCPACQRRVEPVVVDALPKATIGHRAVALTSWLHYGLGVTIDQIVAIMSHHLSTRLTAGGLVAMWQRLAAILATWYEQIAEQARQSAVLHGDETGWRINGKTCWLWCFCSQETCYYVIDRCRGSPVLQKFFTEAFAGVLVRDFWAPYDQVVAGDHQCCLVHLLRELEKVDQHNQSDPWQAFAKLLRRLLRDGIRLRQRADFRPDAYRSRILRLDERLIALAEGQYADADAQRLANRLSRYRDSIFTFLDYENVPFENNHAERQIRPAVVLRKNSQSNRSEKGASTQPVLMSVYRTLKLRGHDPLAAISSALRTYMQTGELPPLPDAVQSTADG
jgi:transposase